MLDRRITQLESMFQTNRQVTEKDILLLKEEKVSAKSHDESMQEMLEKVDSFSIKLDYESVRRYQDEEFIDRYVPIMIQERISDTLTACLDKKPLRRLEEYESNIFMELHKRVLEDMENRMNS